MTLTRLAGLSLCVTQALLDPVQVLVFITVLLVLFIVAVGWRVIDVALGRYNRRPRRRR
ncbi:hypothetical protein [Stigmatella erecta]|uniref:Uncharacterized protein n=1 Tax=Stigmatella erecta TaxID=83460 RepID=A0A1I0JER9_9BACT|nr:hypothetical protein [Stigmatella erecta]SEU08476.1 hypothetical protein SAMN05443639_107198 [Stigmatella erecta]